MPSYRLTIEYEGTRFSGWQAQGNTPKTVQGLIQKAAFSAFGEVEIGGAGRTDAGVHAAGQVAHLRMRHRAEERDIARTLNDALPHDIHIIDVSAAHDRFHARHDAVMRVYLYQISRRRSAFGKPFVWWVRDRLNVAEMQRAASLLPGMHDFSALSDKRATAESKKVVVDFVDVGESGDLLLVRIAASHFLWKMVRKTVSALADVGRGSMEVDRFERLLDVRSERYEPTAPPSGLFLEAVLYEHETFDRPLEPIVPVTTWRAAGGRSGGRKKKGR